MRKCKICGKEKPLEEYTISKRSKATGKMYYKSFCNTCWKVYKESEKGLGADGRFKKDSTPWNKKVKNGRLSKKYYEWRDVIWNRDNNTCQQCYSTKRLHAHHIMEWDKYPSLRFEFDNGITLCNSCHSRIHGEKKCNLLKNGVSWIKGRKMSKEHCKKLSEAHIGIKPTKEALINMCGHTPWNKGIKGVGVSGMKGKSHSIESRKKMSDSRRGKVLTKEHRKNISDSLRKAYINGKRSKSGDIA